MAQLLNPAAVPEPGRISQILPSVKCSNCNHPVPIHELGDHVCQPEPAMPSFKSFVSPLSAIERDPQKYHSKQSFTSQNTMQSQQPITPHQVSASNAHVSLSGAPTSPRTRSRAPSTSSRRSPRAPEPGSSRFDHGPASPEPQRMRPPLAGNTPPPVPTEIPFPPARSPSVSSRSPTPGRGYPSIGDGLYPPRTPSTPTFRATPPPSLANSARPAAHSSPAPSPYASQPQPPVARQRTPGPPTPSQLSVNPGRGRAASSAATDEYEVIYSTSNSKSSPATASAFPPRFPPNAADPTMHPPRQRMPSTSSLPPAQPPTRARAPSTSSVSAHPFSARPQTPSTSGRQFDRRPSNLGNGPPPPMPTSPPGPPPVPTSTPAPGPIRSPVPDIDTKIGGAAGMAGVGRRGFAAAAHAAMLATSMGRFEGAASPLMIPGQGMDGRRANAPKFVDVVSAARYGAYSTCHDNSKSTNAAYRSQCYTSFVPGHPFPSFTEPTTPTSPGPAPNVSTSPSPRLSRGLSNSSQRDRYVPPALEPPKLPLPPMPATPTTPRLPFFEKFKAQQPPSDSPEPISPRPPSPPSDSDSEFGGLAYADDDDDDEELPSPKLPPINTSVPKQTGPSSGGKIRFPSMASESQYSVSSPASPTMPRRTLSDSRASRGPAKSTGALDRVMETLFEEAPSPLTSPAPKSAPLAPEGQRDSVSRPPKLPVRSHTSPTLGKITKGRPKGRMCAKCTQVIDDGRWIQMEGGSVLCDRCWKNMYLPKCRRCNLTIEKQAVSSSDGQLKGKYHRECFNCHKCHKPFPDKTFYVLDGKPFCAYHYHEANDSLCAAPSCGQPIEGPCAVSYSGQRFHPEHLLCEHPRCTERLVEYWEVDGRMLCERHAQGAMAEAADEEGDELDDLAAVMEGVRDSVAIRGMKRMTRFIDLGPSELR
ncbi:uncharacterized protein B0H18DRAFT_993287 [Fomitopsis serialis]|uniref:uncharacterized protein n=1 Tax=Fomitopsis serialis TaxID=139415 RepID=UPI002007C619|nr:uncharacterized protein B0H18DRAFT_993287 [Neoantrodia serialis]KAH9930727.1 hypothetical protein B0H18DRAFT_993287 [Neoantrodia serialis]